jgi:hypothetical protein
MGNELSGSSAGACALSGPPLVDAAGGARPLPPEKGISRRVPPLTTTLRPVVLSGSLQRQPLPHGSGRGTQASTRPLCCCWSPARRSLVAERPGRRGTKRTVSFFVSLHPRRPAMGEDDDGCPHAPAAHPALRGQDGCRPPRFGVRGSHHGHSEQVAARVCGRNRGRGLGRRCGRGLGSTGGRCGSCLSHS